MDFPEIIFAIIVRPISRAYVKNAQDEMTDICAGDDRFHLARPTASGISSQDALLDIYNHLPARLFSC
jgi:hypothetical protein